MRALGAGRRDTGLATRERRGAVPSAATPSRATRAAIAFGLIAVPLLELADLRVADLLHHLTISQFVLPAVVVFAFAGAGAVVAYHQPRNAIGWLLLGVAVFLAINGLASDGLGTGLPSPSR